MDGVYRVFYRLPDGSKKYKIQYDAKLVSPGSISQENFNRELQNQPNIEPVDVEKDPEVEKISK